MATVEKETLARGESDRIDLRKVIEDMMSGKRDPAAMDRAAQALDESRAEIYQRLGTLDMAVDLTNLDDE